MIGELLGEQLFMLAAIVAAGLVLGRVRVAGLSLGSSGVLFAALCAGHYGITVYDGVGTIGLVLFVYAVGVGAGGRFFAALARHGSTFALLTVLVVGSGAALTCVLALALDIPADLAAGIFAGALTSTPALAASIDILGEKAGAVPIGYGIAYPFGVIGVVLFVQLLPRLIRADLKAEAARAARDDKTEERIVTLGVQVSNPEILGRRIADFPALAALGCQVTRVRKGERFAPLEYEDSFERDQLLLLVGRESRVESAVQLIGRRAEGQFMVDADRERRQLILTAREFSGRTLAQLQLLRDYGIVVSRVTRLGITFVPSGETVLDRNDLLTVVGAPANLDRFSEVIGHRPQAFDETDLLSLAIGVALGVIAGRLALQFPGGPALSLGLAGGPLFVGLLLGHFGKIGPIRSYMPRSSRILLQEAGLVLFLADAGVRGGKAFVSTLQSYGPSLFAMGAIITIVPMIVAYVVARHFMRMNLLQALGGICGGMTSTPALGAITARTDSQAPVVSYATAYPVALILMTAFAQAIISLLLGFAPVAG